MYTRSGELQKQDPKKTDDQKNPALKLSAALANMALREDDE